MGSKYLKRKSIILAVIYSILNTSYLNIPRLGEVRVWWNSPANKMSWSCNLLPLAWLALIEEKYDLVRCCPLLLRRRGVVQVCRYSKTGHSHILTAAQCEPHHRRYAEDDPALGGSTASLAGPPQPGPLGSFQWSGQRLPPSSSSSFYFPSQGCSVLWGSAQGGGQRGGDGGVRDCGGGELRDITGWCLWRAGNRKVWLRSGGSLYFSRGRVRYPNKYFNVGADGYSGLKHQQIRNNVRMVWNPS